MQRTTKRLLIRGQVQGVGFRYSMVEAAHRIGVTGWVRNLANGGVEAMVQGEPKQVDEMIRWAKKGPSMARVEGVEVLEGHGEFTEFSITHFSS